MSEDGRYSRLKSRFWVDEKSATWDDATKLLALYLLSSPHANLLGCYVLPKGYICEDLRWSMKKLQKPFKRLLEDGFIQYDEKVRLVFVQNYLKHNSIISPNQAVTATALIKELPASPLLDALRLALEPFAKLFKEPLDHLFPYLKDHLIDQSKDDLKDHLIDDLKGHPVTVSVSIPITETVTVTETKDREENSSPPEPPAITVYHQTMHLRPKKQLYPLIVQAVGENPEALEFWRKICLSWLALGWNPQNVKGLVEFFQRGEIPGEKTGLPKMSKNSEALMKWLGEHPEGEQPEGEQ